MIQSLSLGKITIDRLQSGPLEPYLEALAEALHTEGYANRTIRRYLRRADLFARWITDNGIPITCIDEPTVSLYVSNFQRLKHKIRESGRLPDRAVGIQKLHTVLRQLGVIRAPAGYSPRTAVERWLSDFDRYLRETIGLAEGTRQRYLHYAGAFMQWRFEEAAPDWKALCADDVVNFILEQAGKLNLSSRQSPVTAMRAFLRFLAAKGEVHGGLVGAVPTVRRYKLASLPNYLSVEEVNRVIASCDLTTSLGRRDKAIITLLVRLGLRAGEIVRLRIDDIDWYEGHILVRAGKSCRERTLPLPADVGDTLVNFLRHGRPESVHREVFLRSRPPYRPFKNSAAISSIALRHLNRAGISSCRLGSHVFRHTAATHMVQGGATFKEVADVLGHACLETTAIYAKLDLGALAAIALPWPGGGR